MILVADSGSTKTDWIAYKPEQKISFSSQGLNPFFVNAQDIARILLKKKEVNNIADEVKEVYFFGAGCLHVDKREIVSNGLSAVFKNAFISVDHDLMGSAYATCGNNKGLACILGTGSNIAYFDGETVFSGKHGLGYVLGDEGSGSYFGKKLVTAYLYGKLPKELSEDFKASYAISKDSVIEQLYQRAFPNTYLASFSRFMYSHQQHPYIQNLLKEGFQEFIDTNVKSYKNYKSLACNFVGSISYYFETELRETFNKNNLLVGKVVKTPIEGILDYILLKAATE